MQKRMARMGPAVMGPWAFGRGTSRREACRAGGSTGDCRRTQRVRPACDLRFPGPPEWPSACGGRGVNSKGSRTRVARATETPRDAGGRRHGIWRSDGARIWTVTCGDELGRCLRTEDESLASCWPRPKQRRQRGLHHGLLAESGVAVREAIPFAETAQTPVHCPRLLTPTALRRPLSVSRSDPGQLARAVTNPAAVSAVCVPKDQNLSISILDLTTSPA
ncbi:uncharacterized protein BDZ99DRAFT_515822 [Mytilinidion resinicola]|uniref:Uncharacterized protein n=1 Tax=Mytilinidion resinicola TaxID=574789 RepID=A0A6A6Z4G7_9PEZI|nr:uncharacterized protein BDZ99DRAFT_515822 [Mytilinidion resinicola]KAF2815065.1 hypothetical protein BDZ99DRAFT_515822 [Mytilinidion resinicola]